MSKLILYLDGPHSLVLWVSNFQAKTRLVDDHATGVLCTHLETAQSVHVDDYLKNLMDICLLSKISHSRDAISDAYG